MVYRARGQSLVEFALVLPFLVLIVMSIIDFSFFVYTYSEVENATRRASEYMSRAARDTCRDEAIQDAIDGTLLNKKQLQTTGIVIPSVAAAKPGSNVTVSITDFPVQFLTPVGRTFLKNAKLNFTSQRVILSVDAPFGTSC